MLPEGHPHAWNADHADEHLDPYFRRRFMPEHSRLVVTADMHRLISGVATDLDGVNGRSGQCTVVSGPWGAGKSTLLHALAAVADVNTVHVEIPESANAPAAQWEVLTEAITGSASGTARKMQRDAHDYLTVVPTMLIVDEAQHLTHAALRQLRWLWTAKLPRFAIVLAGSELNERIAGEPSVSTRINRRIALRDHGPDRMLDLLRRSDPDLAATDLTLLRQIDDAYGHGCWRNWSELMVKATAELGHSGPLTFDTAAAVIYDRSGKPLALAPAGAANSPTTRGTRR